MIRIVQGTQSCATCYVAAVDSRETTSRPPCGSLWEEAAAADVMSSSDARSNEPVPRFINQMKGPTGGPSREQKTTLEHCLNYGPILLSFYWLIILFLLTDNFFSPL